jgi:penicillin-binding protein 2
VRRVYPKEQFMAHVLGYVGEASESELDRPEYAAFNPGDTIGKDGLERVYNATLMGKDGQRVSLVNNRGKELQVMQNKEADPGKPLTLTIDLDVQAAAELTLQDKRGAVVALDPRNGDVLAMVSRPAFDPNKFSMRISRDDWKAILDDPETPMFNRALQSRLAPGSSIKPLVALAALEEGAISPDQTVNCPGSFFYGNHNFMCHKHSGHGRMGLKYALALSCDVFFYNVGLSLGIDRFAKWGEIAGLGHRTGIDLPGEASGDLPSRGWKMQRFRQAWLHGDMVSVSIGQGYLTVTPLQLAHAIGGIASGAVWNPPHMVKGEAPREKPRVANVNIDNVQRVVEGMFAVVNQGGTAGAAWLPGIEVCGKTGTSQIISNETLKKKGLVGLVKDNAWFVGFAPRSNPEIVVAALIEGGEHGDRASVIARDVIKAHFDKKARQQQKTPVVPAAPPAIASLTKPAGARP